MSKFTTIGEVLADDKFLPLLNKEITKIEFKRKKIPEGMRLKRGAVNYLQERGLFNAKALTNQYVGIVNKQCELPSNVRAFITSIVRESIQETIKLYEN